MRVCIRAFMRTHQYVYDSYMDIYTLTHSQRNWREYAHVRVSVHLWLRERKGSSVRLGTHLGQLIKHHVRVRIDTTAHCNTLQHTATLEDI